MVSAAVWKGYLQGQVAENFAFIGLGLLALVTAFFLAGVLVRLTRTLAAVEDLVLTTTEEMRETLPELRQSIGHVNDITAGVNVGLRTVGAGAGDVADRVSGQLQKPARSAAAAVHGFKVGASALWRSYSGGDRYGT